MTDAINSLCESPFVLRFLTDTGTEIELVFYDGGGQAQTFAVWRIHPCRSPALVIPAGEA